MPTLTKVAKTVADYMALPDEPRVELIEGEFYGPPAPGEPHQGSSMNLSHLFVDHVKKRKLGRVFAAPFDVVLSDENVVQPDLLFIATENLHRLRDRVYGPPDLVVEILSPTHAERDRIVKRDLYHRYGVREFWIVDTVRRQIEVWKRGDTAWVLHAIFGTGETLTSTVLPDLRLAVDEVFE